MHIKTYVRIKTRASIVLVSLALTGLGACDQQANHQPAKMETPTPAQTAEPSPFILTASIQDIMQSVVDPAADYLWDSVSYISTTDGFIEKQPRTEEEWMDLRRKTITLLEATNLLAMKGRQVVETGKHLEDEGVDGNLTAEEIQRLIDANHTTFVAFAQGLHAATIQALTAIDNKDVDAFFGAGSIIDDACEACHVKYWYPNQIVPGTQK